MIYIDTGAFIARYLTHDQHHEVALNKWDKIKQLQEKCFTSNFILDEFFTLLARKADYKFAAQKARIIYESNVFEVLRPDQSTEEEAIHLFTKYADQKVSFTDCISFILMKQHKIKRAFSFDRHFVSAGFVLY